MKNRDNFVRNAKTSDILLLFEKLDLDQDDVISYKDFVQAFS
jgi:Ca2+-binding EF-hand superfamily protein